MSAPARGRIDASVGDGIGSIVVAHPARHNAMSLAMWRSLADAVAAFDRDDAVRVVVLRGEGTRAFVSGADIAEFDAVRSAATGSDAYDAAVDAAQQALRQCRVPAVAAIHGICMGGGLALALACDLRYCDAQARFRMPAARLGLGYGYLGLRRMVEVLGEAVTGELFFTARTCDGAEAARIGLVNRVFGDAAALDAEVASIARAIADNAPLTVRLAKRTIAEARATDADAAAARIAAARRECIASADYAEGRRAFAEKRAPRFRGR